MQTQTSNTLHNAIMEAGSKDHPPILAPGWKDKEVPTSKGSLVTRTERVNETYKNVSQDIKDQLNAEAEVVQIILTGIDNDIYSTVDACPNAYEMWKAIKRLKHGESINVQDLETNLYWKFRKFISQDGETLESYYSRFYKMMNELIRNQCKATNHQVNVQFLLQLQPEWQRFVTLVKQSQELKTVLYHKLYDILKQHQHEVNEIRAEKIARLANLLTLVAQQQPVYHRQTHSTHYTQNSSTRSQQAATRNRGKATDKEIDKLMALISLSFKKIYKPTNNNLRTSSNTSRANQDNSPRLTEMLGMKIQGLLNAKQADWRDDTDDDDLEDQELEAHYMYMAQLQQEIRDQLNAEAEAVQIILTGIDNDIYSTIDACPNACEMWKAIERLKQVDACPNACEMLKEIERLKQGESINVQDLETNLYWEFKKFTSQDEWQRFVTLVKQSQELKTVSYHKLYDILKQHQHEVNKIKAEKITRVANPLALVAQQQPVYHPQHHPTQFTQNPSTRSQQAATRNRGKAIVTSPQPIYDQEPSMVAENDETSKDNEIDKLMALISLSFKKIYKPINNNLRTSSNTSRANQDNSPRINRSVRYENQRNGNVAGARETVGLSVVQKSGIQCYNCKEFGHVARECQKPKRAKDAAYHREKMLLCKQEEARIQLNAEQADWRDDTDDDELEDQELEAHYMYMAQLQERRD
nr:hypothetical protein [Tanacetum cinerariifolium]